MQEVGEKSAQFCKALINAYPESVSIGAGGSDSLPIHQVCAYGHRLDTVRFLFEFYPESINKRTNGFLPIHEAARVSTEIIEFLLSHNPDGASRTVAGGDPEDEGRLPLHVSCDTLEDNNLNTVTYLFDVYPEAINKTDRNGKLPLDIARDVHENGGRYRVSSLRGTSGETIAFLQTQMNYYRLAKDSEAIITPDGDGRLPIHHALYGDTCLGAIKLLAQGNPQSLKVADREGILPLHLACEYSSCPEVVKFLAELSEDTLNVCSTKKVSALHHACHTGNLLIVKYLLDRQVASVSERNADGMLPIHILFDAYNKRWSIRDTPLYLETLWCLLLAYPEAVGVIPTLQARGELPKS